MDQSGKEKADLCSLLFKHRGGCVDYDHCAWCRPGPGTPGTACRGPGPRSSSGAWRACARRSGEAPPPGSWSNTGQRSRSRSCSNSLFSHLEYEGVCLPEPQVRVWQDFVREGFDDDFSRQRIIDVVQTSALSGVESQRPGDNCYLLQTQTNVNLMSVSGPWLANSAVKTWPVSRLTPAPYT